jgi:hypothetical protein
LSEFWAFARDFNNVYAQIAKFAIAAPLLDLIISIGPPWPSRLAVSFSVVVVQVLVVMCSFAVWRQGRTPLGVVRRWLVGATAVFIVLFLFLYIPVFAVFVVPAPNYRNAIVKGFSYQEDIVIFRAAQKAEGQTWSDKALVAHFVDGTHDETEIWRFVAVARLLVLIAWLLVTLAYAVAVSAFVAIQYRRFK